MLVTGETLAHIDFKELKQQCTIAITELEAKLAEGGVKEPKFDELVEKGMSNLNRLDALFIDGDLRTKRDVIGSIFTGKIVLTEIDIEPLQEMRPFG